MDFLNLPTPTVLAPMAGVTDYAYRCICAEMGASATVTEMVSSRALIYQDRKSRSPLRKTDRGICGAQIFGTVDEVARAVLEVLENENSCTLGVNFLLYDNYLMFHVKRYRCA